MHYPTPQYIEEEGKIVFFLTFRQFFLLVGGGAVCLLLYYLLPFLLFIFLAIPIMLLTAAVAFIKIGNESIVKVFLHIIGFSIGKKNYIWKKKEMSYPLGAQGGQQSKVEQVRKIIETKK
ncbi:MAG: PrgI family protein [Patescibacteria group bacterium]